MGAFWKAIATGFVKAAKWCVGHPDTLVAIVGAVIDAKKPKPAEPPAQ